MVNVAGRKHNKRDRDRKSGFVYRPRKAEDVKRRAERTGGRFDSPFKQGFDTWRPKPGDNLIRVLPPTWEDYDHFGYTIWVHGWIGADNSTFLCPLKMQNKKCPICAAAKEARDAGDADEAKQLQAKEQIVCWILDRNENEKRPQLYVMSWTFDRDIAALTWNKRTGKLLLIDHPNEGYDLAFQRSGQGLNTRYYGQVFDRDPTPILDKERDQEEVLDYIEKNPVPETLQYHSYERMEAALSGEVESKDEDLEEEGEEEGTGRRHKYAESRREEREAESDRRRRRDDDEDEDEDRDTRRAQDKDEEEEGNGEDEQEQEEDEDGNGEEEQEEEEEEEEKSDEESEDEDEDDEDEKEASRRPRRERLEREPLRTRGGNGRSRKVREDDETKTRRSPKGGRRDERWARR